MSRINLDLQASHKMLMLLDEANANTESIVDSIPGVFLIINENHEVLRSNAEFISLFGLDAEDAFRMPISKFFRKESWKIFAHHIKRLVESDAQPESVRFEMGLIVQNESGGQVERPYHWTLSKRAIKNQGEGHLLTVFGDDISEMRAAERRLMDVFATIPLGIFTVNRDCSISNTYSSYLESMLDSGSLAGVSLEDALFGLALENMEQEAIAGVKAIRECLGKSELDYQAFAGHFPQLICHGGKEDGRWLKITYQPIVFDQIVEQLLIILEDRTAIMKAETEMLGAARDREKAIALEKQSQAMYETAIRDPLTGLYTRLYMKDAVAALLWAHDHHEIPEASVVIFDIDHFKAINDTYGHKRGDQVLRQVAQVVLGECRESDIPIRFGGEEFVVFVPSNREGAFALAERVRTKVEAMEVDFGDARIRVTISGGAASHVKGETLDDFMNRADQFLYAAKRNGRNQTMAEQQ